MPQHEVITRGGDAFLLKLRESALSSGSMSEEQYFLLIGITSIQSDRVILAMNDYHVS
ncbi:adhesin biosynthesis transcription regulatory family protein, partial [Escherichia coli]|nr:adhesin biosynthesis transcription regulatory family protein [Escherichia coli]